MLRMVEVKASQVEESSHYLGSYHDHDVRRLHTYIPKKMNIIASCCGYHTWYNIEFHISYHIPDLERLQTTIYHWQNKDLRAKI